MCALCPTRRNATSGSLTYRAWDQTSGSAGTKVNTSSNGGTTAFSTAVDTASITVSAINDAPVLTPVGPVLSGITEDQTSNAGQTVASIVGASISDVDSGAVEGIAVTALTSGNGTWQYSTNGGSSWTAVGAVSNTSALLLRASDYVRFVPNAQNATSGSLTYRAWDQTSGSAGTKVNTSSNGGTTAFSTAVDTASHHGERDQRCAGAHGCQQSERDRRGCGEQRGHAGLGADRGAGQRRRCRGGERHRGDGGGQQQRHLAVQRPTVAATWTAFGSPSDASARLLAADANTYVRFVPNANWNGTVAGGISFRAWDRSSGTAGGTANTSSNGGTTAFSGATASANITVNAVNDAPINTMPAAQNTLQNAPLIFSTANGNAVSISDVDAGSSSRSAHHRCCPWHAQPVGHHWVDSDGRS